MAYFENYEQDKAFWFLTYLQLAEAICHYPSLSAKNSNFGDEVEDFLSRQYMSSRRIYGKNDKKQKRVGL